MANSIVHHSDGVCRTVNLNCVNHPELSWKATGVFVYLCTRPQGWKFSLAGIAAHKNTDGIGAVKAAVRELQELGFLSIEKVRTGEGKISGYEWHIFHGGPEVEKTTYGKSTPEVEKTTHGFTTCGKPTSIERKKEERKKKELTDMLAPDEANVFEELWAKHRRGGKKATKKRFKKALDRVDIDTLRTAYLNYRSWADAKNFEGAHFSTWLNQDRWEEDFSSASKPQRADLMDLSGYR